MAGIGVVCLGLQCGQSMRWSQGQKQLRPARPSAIRPRKVHTKQVDFSLSGERELLKVTVDLAACGGWPGEAGAEWLVGRLLLRPMKVTVTESQKWSVGAGVGWRAETRDMF